MHLITQPATKQICVLYDTAKDGVGGVIGTGLIIEAGSIISGIYQVVYNTFVPINTPLCSLGSDSNTQLYMPNISFIPGPDVPTAMPGGVTGWVSYNYAIADGLEMKLFIGGGKFSAGKCIFIIQYISLPIIPE